METQENKSQEREQGFTLIELLIAIVVVGILTAVAIVGIGGLTDNGKTAACQATADAAKAASAVFYANSTTNAFPATFTAMQGPPIVLDIPSSVTVTSATVLTGKNWTLTMAGGGATAPTFTCAITYEWTAVPRGGIAAPGNGTFSGLQERDRMEMRGRQDKERERGFTLIEMLITVVVVGVLTAVAIMGIDGLVDNGKTSACQASADAAKAASALFFANSTPTAFPADFYGLTTPKKLYEIPTGVTPQAPAIGTVALVGKGWTLEMTPGSASAPPAFSCTY